MKRQWSWGLICIVILSLMACAPAKNVVPDDRFSSMIDLQDREFTLSPQDHAVLLGLLKIKTWKSVNRSNDPAVFTFNLIGESGAVYAMATGEATPVIAMDQNADGVNEAYFEVSSLDVEALLAWRDEVIIASLARDALREFDIAQVILDLRSPQDDSGHFDVPISEGDAIKVLLQLDSWKHLQTVPSQDLSAYDRMTLVSSEQQSLVVTLIQLPDQTLAMIQSATKTLGVFSVPLSMGSAVLAKLKTLAEQLIPNHELANRVFTQGYIGPMQFIYEPGQNDPAYYFSLSPVQQLTMMTWLNPTSWVKQSVGDPTPIYAEFVLVDAEGRTYYFTEVSMGTVVVSVVEPLQSTVSTEYRWDTADFGIANTTLMTYFVPGGPSSDLLDASYVSASFYEGEVMDMTSPDITVALSAAQSKTIKDAIDPSSWKQAVDIPPMGPALGFTLKDDTEREYTFLFVGDYVLVSIRVDETSPVVWWTGSMAGAVEARTYLLTLAP